MLRAMDVDLWKDTPFFIDRALGLHTLQLRLRDGPPAIWVCWCSSLGVSYVFLSQDFRRSSARVSTCSLTVWEWATLFVPCLTSCEFCDGSSIYALYWDETAPWTTLTSPPRETREIADMHRVEAETDWLLIKNLLAWFELDYFSSLPFIHLIEAAFTCSGKRPPPNKRTRHTLPERLCKLCPPHPQRTGSAYQELLSWSLLSEARMLWQGSEASNW